MSIVKKFLFGAIVLATFSQCDKNTDNIDLESDLNIAGSWQLAYDVGHPTDVYSEEWTFNSDRTYEYVFKVLEKESDKLLGYNRLNTGDFSIKGDTLFVGKTKRYFLESDELTYTDRETLLAGKSEELKGDATLIELKDNATKLVFIYLECNDVSDCVGSREFLKI